ncbi:Threonine--tRNA ligase [subsurface metagenome]
MEKIPYMLIFGDKEVEEGLVSVRKRGKGDLGKVKLTKFIEDVSEEIEDKNLS